MRAAAGTARPIPSFGDADWCLGADINAAPQSLALERIYTPWRSGGFRRQSWERHLPSF